MNTILSFFLRRNTVLMVMVAAAVITGLVDGFSRGTGEAWFSSAVIIFVFSALAWFTREEQPVATWTTVICLLLKGSDLLYDAFLGLTGRTEDSILILIAKGIAGAYLSWGALVVHRARPIRQ